MALLRPPGRHFVGQSLFEENQKGGLRPPQHPPAAERADTSRGGPFSECREGPFSACRQQKLCSAARKAASAQLSVALLASPNTLRLATGLFQRTARHLGLRVSRTPGSNGVWRRPEAASLRRLEGVASPFRPWSRAASRPIEHRSETPFRSGIIWQTNAQCRTPTPGNPRSRRVRDGRTIV